MHAREAEHWTLRLGLCTRSRDLRRAQAQELNPSSWNALTTREARRVGQQRNHTTPGT
jgi:hypothetical protein